MKQYLIILLLAVLAFPAQSQSSLDAYERKVFRKGDDSLQYRILYPKNFDPKVQYPLVLILHGAGERGDDNEAQLAYGAKLFLEPENREKYPAIVVFPQCPKDSYWANVNIVTNEDKSRTFNFLKKGKPTKAMNALIGLVNELESTGSINENQEYIGGLSMGGMGTFEMLRRKPDTFVAAFPICGGGHPATAKKFAKRVDLWVFHGEEDSVVPVEKSKIMAEAILKAGGNVKLTLYPGVDHNSWDYAFAEPDLLPWLFSHKKEE
ncbi:dienelactone hydrolase family protein [Pontibacter silvestris]|uniref:Dienelactone hydrolase family protein n=1 Tax=Pontibacter silvestris TaxID=2305183 RepID=A0ABW4X490_9BACT|nr:dienelactone hydrolase family protein [Pontibacter silvestris]MCC9137884.1 dienelactone hydrolase family protein [Pontibacter silvestris]